MAIVQTLQKLIDGVWNLRRGNEPVYPGEKSVPTSGRTQAGVYVTPDRALLNGTVWAAHRYLTQTVAQLPARIIQKTSNGNKPVFNNRVDDVLNWRPNPELSPFQLRETLTGWAIMHGNGVAEIEKDQIGRIKYLWPIEPKRIEFLRNQDTGELIYRVDRQGLAPVDLRSDEVFHLRGYGNGPVGLSVIEYAAQTIGWARATELFGASFFGEGMHFGGAIINKKPMDAAAINRQRAELNQTHRGASRAGKWFIGDDDMTITKMTATPEEAQFVETMQYQVEEICFIPGTEILTNTGIKAIELIEVGDKVLTHKGRWRRVNNVMCNDYIGEVVTTKARGLDKITETPDHPFYVQNVSSSRTHGLFSSSDPGWIEAKNLSVAKRQNNGRRSKGDFQNLVMPRLKRDVSEIDLKEYAQEWSVTEENKIKVSSNGRANFINRFILANNDLGWLCGLFVGDGSTTEQTVVIYTGWKEKETIEKTRMIFKKLFDIDIFVSKAESVARITVNNKILASFFRQFGHESHLKSLPEWCLEQSSGFAKGLLEGLVDSDGYVYKNRTGLRTTSLNLAWQTRFLVWSFGINTSLSSQSQQAWRIGGRTGESRDIHTVEWVDSDRRGNMGVEEEHVYFPLDLVEKSFYTGKVHNLEVEEDESYTTVGGVVHNCRWMGAPPHKVHHLLRMTYNNVEQMSIDVVGDSIVPWALRLEQEATYKLFGQNRDNLYVKFEVKGLLRGDYKSRQEGLQIQRRNGIINGNDWAEIEDIEPPIEGGEVYIVEKNMVTLEQLQNPPVKVSKSPQPTQPPTNFNNDLIANKFLDSAELVIGKVDV